MGVQGSPALERLLEAVLERGLMVTPIPAWNTVTPGYWITLGPGPVETAEAVEEKPAGEIGGIGA